MKKRKGRQSGITETLIHSNGEDEFGAHRSEDSEDDEKSGFFACYLLTSLCPRYKGHTYIGFTVNPRRRIRQHNGELCSGASRTKKKRPWEMVLCIYGFPTNVAALQFEWAWQHPVESLAVRKAAVSFKSLGGLANKIKLAYTMLTLPAWNNLNLNVNFFSTQYTKHYAGCPTLPSHMRVHIRSMDELPCYTEGYKDDEDDMFGFENDLSDNNNNNNNNNEEPIKSFEDYEQSSYSYKDMLNDDGDDKEHETLQVSAIVDHQKNGKDAIRVSDDENYDIPRRVYLESDCFNTLDDDDDEHETIQASVIVDHQKSEKEAICVSDDENYDIPRRVYLESDCFNIVSPIKLNENDETNKKKVDVEVVDLFTPSPEYRSRKKRGVSVVCPEIIDLTESPICV